jgi:hypothetical protein
MNNKTTASLAGMVTSTVSGNTITFNQALSLQQDDCVFPINAHTATFSILSNNQVDTLQFQGSNGKSLKFTRTTPGNNHPHEGTGSSVVVPTPTEAPVVVH